MGLGVIAFALTLQISLAGVFRNTRPQLALTVVPIDAAARAKLASQLVSIEEGKSTARALALDAIRRDPIQPGALRVLAQSLDETDPDSTRTAMQLMDQSERLTRRDVLTQMWFVDHFARLGDGERMVAHFDNILRSSEGGRSGAFPMLALAASTDPKVEKILLDKLSKRPNWAEQFAIFAVGSGTDLDFANNVAQLILDVNDSGHRKIYGTLINRLVEKQRFDTAWEAYSKTGLSAPGAAQKTIRNGDLEGGEGKFPFEWIFRQEPDLWAAREKGDKSNGFVLQLAATNGRSGEVAGQLLHLAPGPYRLDLRLGNVPTAKFERPELRLYCVGAGNSTKLLNLVPDTAGPGPFDVASSFVVPQDCAFQRIGFQIANDGPLQSAVPWVDSIRIR